MIKSKCLQLIYVLFLLFFQFHSKAQTGNIAIGQWRTHSSFRNLALMAFDGNKIYASPSDKSFDSNIGTMFSVDKDGEIVKYGKENGLNEFGISQIGYSKSNNTLVVAYQNGLIDFISSDGRVNKLTAIKDKEITGLKSANHLYFHKNVCFISYDFGIIIINLLKFEITETISSITNQQGSNIFKSTTIQKDTLFALSEKGLFKAAYNPQTNLMDVNNWEEIKNLPIDLKNESLHLVSYNNNIYLSASRDGVYTLNSNRWEQIADLKGVGYIYNFLVSDDKLLLVSSSTIFAAFDGKNFQTLINSDNRGELQNAILENNNTLWVATSTGLYKISGDLSQLEQQRKSQLIKFSSPYSNLAFKSFYNSYKDELIVLAGGYSSSLGQRDIRKGYYIFKDGIWYNSEQIIINHNYKTEGQKDTTIEVGLLDIVDVTYDPAKDYYYFATYGWGLASLNPRDSSYFLYYPENSTLQNSFNPGARGGIRVASLAIEDSKLWAISEKAPGGNITEPINTLKNGKWTRNNQFTNISALQTIIDSSGYKWFRNADYILNNFLALIFQCSFNCIFQTFKIIQRMLTELRIGRITIHPFFPPLVVMDTR
ncbi:MAG: hypothetical protein EAZ07_04030 [Cytophagales bacterium]|nr:MAG: hypothetical protein EAZ07_04030 [Cytophagales bacterium]